VLRAKGPLRLARQRSSQSGKKIFGFFIRESRWIRRPSI